MTRPVTGIAVCCRSVHPPDMNAVWDLAETQRLIEHPAVRLLRSPNCALTLTFLHRAFKEHHAIAVPESHLRARLENFLDEARSHRPGAYQQAAGEYLSAWCGTSPALDRQRTKRTQRSAGGTVDAGTRTHTASGRGARSTERVCALEPWPTGLNGGTPTTNQSRR